MEQILSSFWDLIITFAMAMLTVLFVQGFKFLKLRAKEIQNDSMGQLVETAISTAEYVVNLVVMKLQQEVVGQLKAAAKDGKLTELEIEDITQKALKEIKLMLSDDTVGVLKSNFGDMELYIRSVIQKKVMGLKETKG